MTTSVRYNATTLVAGQDLDGADHLYRPIAVGGTIVATNAGIIGVLLNKAKSGSHISVAYEGEVKLYAGGAITAGNGITNNASGWFTAAAAGSFSVGKALETVASGDLFRALVDFRGPTA